MAVQGVRKRASGFTLVEFMVTVSVLAIVMAVAMPSMSDFSANNQLVAAKSNFAGAVALARTEAARSGQTVIVQAAAGGSSGNEYANGWSIYIDVDGDGTVNTGDTRVRTYDALPAKVKLGGASSFSFRPTGYLTGTAAQSFTVCRVSGSSAGYQVTVQPSGIASVAAITSC